MTNQEVSELSAGELLTKLVDSYHAFKSKKGDVKENYAIYQKCSQEALERLSVPLKTVGGNNE